MIAEALRSAFTRGHVIGDGERFLLAGQNTAAGERVSPASSLKVASVYASVTIISSAVRAMPLDIRLDSGNGVLEPRPTSRLWSLLHDQPNEEMHADELWGDRITPSLLLRGNAFLWLERGRSGRVEALWPLSPQRVHVDRDPRTRRKVFLVSAADDRERIAFVGTTDEILHIRGPGNDPLVGVSVIHHLRETIGRALSEDRHAATTMRNQGRPSGILTIENKLDRERRKRLRDQWEAAHGGASKAGRTAVLEEGASWQAVTMTAADLELVRQRAISREDIAIAFQIPGDMLLAGSQANLHYSTDATRDVRLVKHAVMPWAKRIQDALEVAALLPWGETGSRPGRLVPRFDPAGLLRADIKTRYEAYQLALDAGWLTPNEVRAVEDHEPISGLDRTKPQITPEPQQRNGSDPLHDLARTQ